MSYIVNLLYSFSGVIVFSFACLSLGVLVIKISKIKNTSALITPLSGLALVSTQFLLGHGILSLIFLTLGGLYKLTPLSAIIILALGLFSGLGQLKNSFQGILQQGKLENHRHKTIFWLASTILFLTLLLSSARISYDSSAIYFSDAKLTALTHHIRFFTNDTFVASVFHSAIQYAAIIQIFGDQSARMLSWVNGIVIIIFSLALGEKVGLSKGARFILLTLLLTSTAFVDLLGDGKVDLVSSAPAIAAIYWMIVKGLTGILGVPEFLLIGFLTGLAILGRPFNAFLLGIFVILFYFKQIVPGKWIQAVKL